MDKWGGFMLGMATGIWTLLGMMGVPGAYLAAAGFALVTAMTIYDKRDSS